MTIGLNILTNPSTSNAIQNSVVQVLSEGSLKAVGRPVFTLMDKNAEPEARKYSATKEFLFQSLSMIFYLTLIGLVLKPALYKGLRKMFKDTQPGFAPENLKKFNKVFKEAQGTEEFKKYIIPKGAQEAVNILTSGVIITILAPQVVKKIMHPIMEKLDEHKAKKAAKKNLDGDAFVKTNTKA